MHKLALLLFLGSAVPQWGQTQAVSASTVATQTHAQAVTGVLVLHTTIDSRGTKEGKEVKASLLQAVTLPTGVTLPKGTDFAGTVVAVSKHSKDKPNGALVLDFTRAMVKGSAPVAVLVRIQTLDADSGANPSTTLPNSNGNMASLNATSGGPAQLNSDFNDRSDLKQKYKNGSSIDGVYFAQNAAFALNGDVYLDSGIRMTVLLATAAPAQK